MFHHDPPSPPRLTLQIASPPLPSSSPNSSAAKPSRNNLFDQDWAPITPNVRSRSSTAESRFSAESESAGSAASSGRSWMDARGESDEGARRTGRTSVEKTSMPGTQRDDFTWPITPTSPPVSFHPPRPPRPPPVFSLPPSPPSPDQPTNFPARNASHSDQPSLPPTAGHSDNPLLDTRQSPSLRLSPSPPYLLGEGRHATVYLASFTSREHQARPTRHLCAAKRVFPDRESQVSGLGEAFILAKLTAPLQPSSSAGLLASPTLASSDSADSLAQRGAKHILRLYGVRDERDGLEPPLPLLTRSDSRRSSKRHSGETLNPPSPLHREFAAAASPEEPQSASPRKGPHHSEPLQRNSTSKLSLLAAFEPPLTSSKRRASLHGPPAPARTLAPSPLPAPEPLHTPRIDLLLEYCPFGHVLQFARQHPQQLGRERWLTWARELTAAVGWAHERGVLHADVKPQNVMIAPDLTLRLADFGMSLFLPPASSSSSMLPSDPHGLGTPSYSPPEFVRPLPSPFSYSADIFSLGITLSVLLTAREPYEGLRAVERMLWVGRGGWWDWEERRRLRDREEGDELEAEDGNSSTRGLEFEHLLSRQGSVRSTRSARSSLRSSAAGGSARSRRSESVESVRSAASAGAGPDWEAIAASLLLDSPLPCPDPDDAEVPAPAMIDLPNLTLPLSPPPSRPTSLDLSHGGCFPATEHDYYPGTTTPVQYFLDGEEVVPLEVRELIRAMSSPEERERPTARQVLAQLDALAETYDGGAV
ncbi:hypothetical protein JCM21900_002634 [Sporobolomyces salmonicolor]